MSVREDSGDAFDTYVTVSYTHLDVYKRQVVTGMILALNMPPEIALWIPALGGVFAIIVVKQLYGGLGQNFMNPALARCV